MEHNYDSNPWFNDPDEPLQPPIPPPTPPRSSPIPRSSFMVNGTTRIGPGGKGGTIGRKSGAATLAAGGGNGGKVENPFAEEIAREESQQVENPFDGEDDDEDSDSDDNDNDSDATNRGDDTFEEEGDIMGTTPKATKPGFKEVMEREKARPRAGMGVNGVNGTTSMAVNGGGHQSSPRRRIPTQNHHPHEDDEDEDEEEEEEEAFVYPGGGEEEEEEEDGDRFVYPGGGDEEEEAEFVYPQQESEPPSPAPLAFKPLPETSSKAKATSGEGEVPPTPPPKPNPSPSPEQQKAKNQKMKDTVVVSTSKSKTPLEPPSTSISTPPPTPSKSAPKEDNNPTAAATAKQPAPVNKKKRRINPKDLPPPLSELHSHIRSLITSSDLTSLKKIMDLDPERRPEKDGEIVEAWEERELVLRGRGKEISQEEVGKEVGKERVEWPGKWTLANEVDGVKGRVGGLGLAAGRGHLEIVKYLVEDCGAMVDQTDAGLETPLHKASYGGHGDVVRYLAKDAEKKGAVPADVAAVDADGWTALHNASSKGNLDIVRFLIEEAGGKVDVQSKVGWTPLMNAASKGHLPIVRYLTTKHKADPFIRNSAGETAFDVAASVFEIHITDVLASYESQAWSSRQDAPTTTVPSGSNSNIPALNTPPPPYNPLSVHSVVPIVLYENQRLDLRIKSIAAFKKPRFTAKAISRNDGTSPFTLPTGYHGINSGRKPIAVGRSGLKLPDERDPFKVGVPRKEAGTVGAAGRTRDGRRIEPEDDEDEDDADVDNSSGRSPWYWTSDWFVELTDPGVDSVEGWQYANTFSAAHDQWSSSPPQDLDLIMNGDPSVSSAASAAAVRAGTKWVRRKRWARIMRRRLDGPYLGYADVMEETEAADAWQGTGGADDLMGFAKGKGRAADEEETDDYISRAVARLDGTAATMSAVAAISLAGSDDDEGTTMTRGDMKKTADALELAVAELRNGILNDGDRERKGRAAAVLDKLLTRLEVLEAQTDQNDDQDDDEEVFLYSGVDAPDDEEDLQTTYPGGFALSPGPMSMAAPTEYFPKSIAAVYKEDYAPLRMNSDFKVPTNESPSVRGGPSSSSSRQRPRSIHLRPRWQPDEEAMECRRCSKRFGMLTRRHHCRRCGFVVCAQCSPHTDKLSPSEVVRDPNDTDWLGLLATVFRTCNTCHQELTLPAGLNSPPVLDLLSPPSSSSSSNIHRGLLSTPQPVWPSVDGAASDVSELTECPVCGKGLAVFGEKKKQEEHLKNCLEGSDGSVNGPGRYLVFTLPSSSPLLGQECVICFETFAVGNSLGRLPCLCYFHQHCISAWLVRGRFCPNHMPKD